MEVSLIVKLETSATAGLYDEVASFLQPFTALITAEETTRNKLRSKKKTPADSNCIRALAKEFLPFLSQALKILPCRLSDGRSAMPQECATELFEIYELVLECLVFISPCLAGKPYTAHSQRVRYVRCLEGWGRYQDAQREGFKLLERLRDVTEPNPPPGKGRKKKRNTSYCSVPDPHGENADKQLAFSVLEVVLSIITCTHKSSTEESVAYCRILHLLERATSWFRVLDPSESEKFHRAVVGAFCKCSIAMATKSSCFDEPLLRQFCMTALNECLNSSSRDQLPKMARKLCYSLEWRNREALVLDILKFCVESLICECKVDIAASVNEVLDFVFYFSCKCRDFCNWLCDAASACLTQVTRASISSFIPTATILKMYAAGLCSIKDDTNWDLSKLADLVGQMAIHIRARVLEARSQKSLLTCRHAHGKVSLSCYIYALDFLCKPFAECINTTWKHVLSEEIEDIPFVPYIHTIQDVFFLFCETFLTGFSNIDKREGGKFQMNRSAVFHVAMSVFRVSLRTNREIQKSVDLINQIILTEWIQLQELKFLISSLYNIGVTLLNSKQLDKALIALKLSYGASLALISLLCQKPCQADNVAVDKLSAVVISDTVSDACAKAAVYLDVFHQCGHSDVKGILTSTLLNWSIARDLWKMKAPSCLVKQWVKIICKDATGACEQDTPLSLCSLLPLSCSLTTVGIILEEELLAYSEMEIRNPHLCQKMQLKIVSILLEDVYVAKEFSLQRSRVLVSKGRIIRATGIASMNSCIQCLSEAMSLLEELLDEQYSEIELVYHELALLHCLHAVCIQELDQNLEVILHDVACALKLWSNVNMNVHLSSDCPSMVKFGKAVPLLCHIADLLLLKGCLNLQFEIHKLIITLSKWNEFSLERCLAMLWVGRRLCHSLCISPISEVFLLNMSCHFGRDTFSVGYWINCIEAYHPSSLLDFCQKLVVGNAHILQDDTNCHENFLKSDVAFEKIEGTASTLASHVPTTIQSTFQAGFLYYDLSERLISSGKLLAALSSAKEALRLRKKLLYRKFAFSSDSQYQSGVNIGESPHYRKISDVHLDSIGFLSMEIWPDIIKLQNLEDCILSPWSILRCYLESCLQVGIIYESSGNGVDAEVIFLVGKKISVLQKLPLFVVAFGCFLGRIYCKKRLWSMAKNELENAKKILYADHGFVSCNHCKLVWDINLDLQIGDLYKRWCSLDHSLKNQTYALNLYTSALQKLGHTSRTLQPKRPCSHQKSQFCSRLNPISKVRHDVSITYLDNSFAQFAKINDEADQDFDTFIDKDSLSMEDILFYNWEFHQRCLSMKLLNRIARCTRLSEDTHKIHVLFSDLMALFQICPVCQHDIDISGMLKFMEDEYSKGLFVAEYATFLYNISLFLMESQLLNKSRRNRCCDLLDIDMPTIISWLLQAFVLSWQLPLLIQKVSRLLSILLVLSTMATDCLLPACFGNSLSLDHWVAYFHQVSIGTYLQHQHLSCRWEQRKLSNTFEFSDCNCSICLHSDRHIPAKMEVLENFVNRFFVDFPNVTVACISLLSSSFVKLLANVLQLSSCFPAWLFLSRFSSNRKPFTVLIPINFMSEEAQDVDCSDGSDADEDDSGDCSVEAISITDPSNRMWRCPWGCTLLDDVAPQFKSILEENYFSTLMTHDVDTHKGRSIWWTRRARLNNQLDRFLRNLEDSWLGPWRCLLLGECEESKCLDKVLAQLVNDLESKYGFQAHNHLLRIILGGVTSAAEAEKCISQLFYTKGHVGSGPAFQRGTSLLFSSFNDASVSQFPQVRDAFLEVSEAGIRRSAVVLVMDVKIQMLPWESLPVLRTQEIYRMPSVGIISMVLKQKQIGKKCNNFPLVDPSDAYYVLNPSGDLSSTQLEFEEWFKDQKWKGQVGKIPTVEELAEALKSHDLFLYFGHGSGIQYIPGNEIRKLDHCSASVLMGCSSGSLSLTGPYAPQGAPLSYLLACSPAIVCNLWDVTDKDIDRFGKALIEGWLKETYSPGKSCSTCCHISVDSENAILNGRRGKRAQRTKESRETLKGCSDCRNSNREARLASFIGQAREACRFPVLIGASVVCYGVPTTIMRKDGIGIQI